MNKNSRKNRAHRPESRSKGKQAREESSDARNKGPEIKISSDTVRFVRNRCCLVRPKQRDFTHTVQFDCPQIYGNYEKQQQKRLSLLSEQYGFEPVTRGSSLPRVDCKTVSNPSETENKSPSKDDFGLDAIKFVETLDGTQWQNIESVSDLDEYIQEETKGPPAKFSVMSQNVHIAEVPKVKLIAEKFSKFQSGNVELRRLDEKVVCVEYEVFDRDSTSNVKKPIQSMRTFFSIKPLYEKESTEKSPLTVVPSKIRNQFNLAEEDFNNLTQSEIEIIDETIEENKSYLEDLKRVVKRAECERVKKDRSALDLMSLYEKAKQEKHLENKNFSHFLSNKELKDVKNLILQQCASSVHGINRRILKAESKIGSGILSGCLLAELFNDNGANVLTEFE